MKAEMSYGDSSRKAQMKQANASGAAYAVIIGEEELANGAVSVKDLYAEVLDAASKQVLIPRETLVEFLRSKEREQFLAKSLTLFGKLRRSPMTYQRQRCLQLLSYN